uniref:Xylose isomerase n=1 Tax=Homalodisca liturata TaxID=320908 RepID=A0A1B6JGC2_9HEMI
MFSAQTVKRQKTSASTLRDASARTNVTETNEFFPGLAKVEYKPDGSIDDTLSYRYFNSSERIHGRPMEDWLRPSISFWQAFHFTGSHGQGIGWNEPNFTRSWEDGTHSLDSYKRRLRAAFEFYNKLGVKYWTVWDRDLAPEGDTLEETNHNLDESVEFVNELQHRHGIKPLWFAANLHYNSRYNNGALTSSEAQVISYAGAQIKKALEVAHKLGAESFLFRGVKEGYSSTLNTDHTRQLRNYARLLKMAADYKERLGYRGQLLFEPNYEDFYTNYPAGQAHYYGDQKTYYHYDYDTTSAICFLKQYGLDRQFKISSKPGHQLILASAYGMLGSVDATSITSPPPLSETTELIKAVIENGGLQPGGINIGVKLRPDSLDLKDLAVSYVATIDAFGKALRIATKIIADGVFIKNLQQRYLSFHSGFGSRFMNGEASLEECEEHTRKQNGDASYASGRSEHWQALFHRYTQN